MFGQKGVVIGLFNVIYSKKICLEVVNILPVGAFIQAMSHVSLQCTGSWSLVGNDYRLYNISDMRNIIVDIIEDTWNITDHSSRYAV